MIYGDGEESDNSYRELKNRVESPQKKTKATSVYSLGAKSQFSHVKGFSKDRYGVGLHKKIKKKKQRQPTVDRYDGT